MCECSLARRRCRAHRQPERCTVTAMGNTQHIAQTESTLYSCCRGACRRWLPSTAGAHSGWARCAAAATASAMASAPVLLASGSAGFTVRSMEGDMPVLAAVPLCTGFHCTDGSCRCGHGRRIARHKHTAAVASHQTSSWRAPTLLHTFFAVFCCC